MPVISRSVYLLAIVDALIVLFMTMFSFAGYISAYELLAISLWALVVYSFMFYSKGFYAIRNYSLKDIYLLFETVTVSTAIAAIPPAFFGANLAIIILLIINAIGIFSLIFILRFLFQIYTKHFKSVKNVLIVGAR